MTDTIEDDDPEARHYYEAIIPGTSLMAAPTFKSLSGVMSQEYTGFGLDDPTHPSRRKEHHCYFCSKPYRRIDRHMFACHQDRSEVQAIMNMPAKSANRLTELKYITRLGDFVHNADVLKSKKGPLTVIKKGLGGETGPNYVPCPYCLGMMMEKFLWRHLRICAEAPSVIDEFRQNSLVFEGRSLLLSSISSDEVFNNDILAHLGSDEVGVVAKNDPLIVQFGRLKFDFRGTAGTGIVFSEMRMLARFLIELQKDCNEPLQFFINPNCYDLVVSTIRTICGSQIPPSGNVGKASLEKHTLALNFGCYLRQLAGHVRSTAIKDGQIPIDRLAKEFLRLLDQNYRVEVLRGPPDNNDHNSDKSVALLPLTEDLMQFKNYTSQIIEKTVGVLLETPTCKSTWAELARATLARMVVFNAVHFRQVVKLLVEDYQNKIDFDKAMVHENFQKALSETEMVFGKSLDVIQVICKDEMVHIFVPTEIQKAMTVLHQSRESAEIDPSNPFFFATDSSHTFIGDLGSLNSLVRNESQLFLAIASGDVKIRKFVATVSHLLDMDISQFESLNSHFAESRDVHQLFDSINTHAMEMVKAGILLSSIDDAKTMKLVEAGTTLDDALTEGFGISLPTVIEERQKKDGDMDDPEKLSFKPESSLTLVPRQSLMTKHPWKMDERNAVLAFFSLAIENGVVPRKEEILNCKEKYKTELQNREWRNIKDYVFNAIKKKQLKNAKNKLVADDEQKNSPMDENSSYFNQG